MSYTNGPWIARMKDSQEWAIDAPNGDNNLGSQTWKELVTIYGNDDYPKMGEIVVRCNAQLIAAAPEMYEVLKELIANASEHDRRGPARLFVKACSAIAKAEGGRNDSN